MTLQSHSWAHVPKGYMYTNVHYGELIFFKILKNECIYFNWRLITLQYCGGFCHTLT